MKRRNAKHAIYISCPYHAFSNLAQYTFLAQNKQNEAAKKIDATNK